ncbi:hypothetical protein DPEC_G00083760 [Dallia pectoralis]|uniref:Uncharacterized protein n=1 Tax=Dallia pectoralis TaxID=75939 RepID=A0ACC2GZN0_DALPE|nr:hypothetical protein DPEC_G00083760 [Dallia pectoralis]
MNGREQLTREPELKEKSLVPVMTAFHLARDIPSRIHRGQTLTLSVVQKSAENGRGKEKDPGYVSSELQLVCGMTMRLPESDTPPFIQTRGRGKEVGDEGSRGEI